MKKNTTLTNNFSSIDGWRFFFLRQCPEFTRGHRLVLPTEGNSKFRVWWMEGQLQRGSYPINYFFAKHRAFFQLPKKSRFYQFSITARICYKRRENVLNSSSFKSVDTEAQIQWEVLSRKNDEGLTQRNTTWCGRYKIYSEDNHGRYLELKKWNEKRPSLAFVMNCFIRV
jgi:hypothetical protein